MTKNDQNNTADTADTAESISVNQGISEHAVQAMLATMTPEIHQRFLDAIAIGKWPTGQMLTNEQRSLCMEAVILYEHKHLQEHERTGYVPPKSAACDDQDKPLVPEDEKPISWRS